MTQQFRHGASAAWFLYLMLETQEAIQVHEHHWTLLCLMAVCPLVIVLNVWLARQAAREAVEP